MTREEQKKIRLKKIMQVFTYMVEQQVTQNEAAEQFGIDRGTMVKWKKVLQEIDIELYEKVQQMADNNNTKNLSGDVEKRTNEIAKAIIKYRINVKQAIEYCGYEVSRTRVSHDFKRYLDEGMYALVGNIIHKFKPSKEQTEFFDKLMRRKLLEEKEQVKHVVEIDDEKISKKSITVTTKEKIAVESVKYMVENNASLSQASNKFNIAKTTLVYWIHEFIPNKYSDLYEDFKKKMEYDNKQVMSEDKKIKQQKDTLQLAYFILEHPEMPFNKITEKFAPYISRTQATRYIYQGLYELDQTPNKMLYLTVMRQISKFDRRGIEYSQSKQNIQKVEQEIEYPTLHTLNSKDIEYKVLVACSKLVNNESISKVASDMDIEENDLITCIQEVLPFIDNQMYQLIKTQTTVFEREDKVELSFVK